MKGIKITRSGDVAISNDLVLDGKLPLLRADIKARPLHFGSVSLFIDNLQAGEIRDVVRIPHGYSTAPSHLFFWSYPAGNPDSGIGYFEAFIPAGVLRIRARTTDTDFIIEADGGFLGSPASDVFLQLRYYVMVNRFIDA